MKRFHSGIVIGKFCPPHRGHHFLINSALSQCHHVSVLVCWKEEQSVPIHIRMECLKEEHPEATIIEVKDTLADDDTQGWAKYTLQILKTPPDAVFSSEDYGEPYAKLMGAKHIMVDRERVSFPCSATLIRQNPNRMFDWLSPFMRAFYVKRICLVGAESTGKTTLAQELAAYYQTNWVPEYGREYCEKKWETGYIDQWTTNEFVIIAEKQAQLEDIAARIANRLLICDTDPFATSIWHERYMNFRSHEIEIFSETRKYDLYILTGDEIPFVQDGFRDGESIRHWMHQQFVTRLTETQRNWIMISGTREERLVSSIRIIDKLLSDKAI